MEICPPFYPPYMALPSGNFTLAPWFAGKSPLSSAILPLKPPKGTSGEFLSLPSLLRQRVEKGERPKRRFHFWEIWKYHGYPYGNLNIQKLCMIFPLILMDSTISMRINGNIHELCMIFPLILMSSKIQTRSF